MSNIHRFVVRGSVCACALSLRGHAVHRVREQAELQLMRRCVLRDSEQFFRGGELGVWICAVPPVVMWGSSCSVAAVSAAPPGPACYSAL